MIQTKLVWFCPKSAISVILTETIFAPQPTITPKITSYGQVFKDKTVQQSRLKSLGNIPLSEAPSMHTLSCTKQGLIPVSKVTKRGKQHMYN